MPVYVVCDNPNHLTRRFETVASAESYSLGQAIIGDRIHRVLDADPALRQLEAELSSPEFAVAMEPRTFPFPTGVTAGELADWLDGAGFDLTTTIKAKGFESQVFTVRVPTVGWPEHVGVVVDWDGAYVATAHYANDDGPLYVLDHPYEAGCHCDACHDESEFLAEGAALRKVGL